MTTRLSFGRAFRTPTLFYNANTYVFTAANILRGIRTGRQKLDAEITETFEWGLKWQPKPNFNVDFELFRTETSNFISYNFETDFEFNLLDNAVTIGYFNDENSKMLLNGFQTAFRWRNILPDLSLNLNGDLTFSQGEEVLPFNNGTIDQVRMQPKWLGHLHLAFDPVRDLTLGIRYTGSSGWLRRIALDETNLENGLDEFQIDGFHLFDMYGRWQINPNFQAALQIDNLFNEIYGGISATGFLDDLAFNPQPLRHYRLSISYLLN